ncbi:retron Eco8 family effector endonuclease [Sporosarcina koreensis]|uniref:Retron Eco8 family effector endonuclease n=1 Tax=Sporosarcina koreensis TaxID=334735 RepID=A0ABW0TW34_9BACL
MIQFIHVQGFKSLEDVFVNGEDHIQSFIGKNGSGKTTLFKAIKYFFDNLIEDNYSEEYYDQNNRYNYELKIKIRFNLSRLIDSNKRVANNNYTEKIKRSLAQLKEKDSFTLVLTQNKRKGIQWNLPYEYRYLIHNSHPIYLISTHETDFQKWDFIWEIIGSLGNIFDYEESTSFNNVFTGKTAENFKENVKYIENVFESSGYNLQKESNQSQLAAIYQLALRGSKINRDGFELNYFSTETNSLSYLKLLVTLVQKLEQEKVKSPIIIIDEPELGLHPQYIDEIKDLLFLSKGIQFFISTHSSRYLAEVMRQGESVYKFYLKDKYSVLNKIPKLTNARSRIIFSEREASYYFGSFILIVEGQSELEVFKNPKIQELFPKMKKVEVSPTLTNSVLLQTLTPSKMNLPIPYLIVADIDKALEDKYSTTKDEEKKRTFKVGIKKKEEYSPFSEAFKKELRAKFIKNRWMLEIINARILEYEDLEFKINTEVGTMEEPMRKKYEQMIRDLKRYYELFGVYLLFPTLEGALINENNMEDFLRIFKIEFREESLSKREILFRLRQLVGGNSEDLKCRKEQFNGKYSFTKTSGWITEFINSIFEDIDKEESIEVRREIFKEKFPDIYGIINKIDKMI